MIEREVRGGHGEEIERERGREGEREKMEG